MLPDDVFEQLVVEALETLSPFFQAKMSNVEVLVEKWPSRAVLKETRTPPGYTLLGLYQGIPLTERTQAYNLVTPDTITLYQGPIEEAADGDYETIRQQVRHTVMHELAHHFGIDDDRLHELGKY